ncbi:ATP-binding protein [Coleofasciculus sp. FACHB-SPT9]|uniref:ATP-binding protein n=1 Tax=Cyanophyceae TaxID=3028117 RepID=UPI001688E349|nr:ATP-binding protein [Coleofasciculus sp. FACHB-SPT9]MBD1890782.1 AAA family ATPase [Coleofasciculus sp. FACHB-SPT9]
MKLVNFSIKNVKSFRESTSVSFDDKLNILIGPNGGGKSNFLDIITVSFRRFLLLTYEVSEDRDKPGLTIRKPFSRNPIDKLLEKYIGDNTESQIEIKIKVDKQDIDNIRTLKKYSKEFKRVLEVKYSIKDYSSENQKIIELIDRLNDLPETISLDPEVNFLITNNKLAEPEFYRFERDYLIYLNSLELCLILAKDISDIELNPIYLYFSPYRSENNFTTQINLAANNYYELLAEYLEASSKKTASIIKLASLHFAEKKRIYEYKSSKVQGDTTLWNNDEEVKKVTEILEKLGFSWDLPLINTNKNIYEIILSKQNQEFSLAQASSGEKEIINFILGLFALNIKGGLLIIDEPELHLHPKWQSLFLDVLIDLAEMTNQSIYFVNALY